MVQRLFTRQPERTVPGRPSQRCGRRSELVRVEAPQVLPQVLRDENQTKVNPREDEDREGKNEQLRDKRNGKLRSFTEELRSVYGNGLGVVMLQRK